jgi:hypothetical protein
LSFWPTPYRVNRGIVLRATIAIAAPHRYIVAFAIAPDL